LTCLLSTSDYDEVVLWEHLMIKTYRDVQLLRTRVC